MQTTRRQFLRGAATAATAVTLTPRHLIGGSSAETATGSKRGPRAAAGPGFRLENDAIAIVLDRQTARLVMIENKLAGERYQIDDAGLRIEVGAETTPGTLGFLSPAPDILKSASCDRTEARYTYSTGPLALTVTWRLEAGDIFAVQRARIDYAGPGKFNIARFAMFDWRILPKPRRSIPYYGFLRASVLQNIEDGEETPPSDTSTAFFHRFREGGIFSALSCDFVLMQDDEKTARCRSTYWPGFILEAGQPFESERGIVGIYRRKGMFHAPVQASAQLPSFHRPNVDTRLDRGEIDAMSAAVSKFIKPGVYMTLVNGWGVGFPRMIESQTDADTFMRGIDTLVKIPGVEALHFVHSWCGLTREFRELGVKMPLTPNPFARQVFEHARRKGLNLSMFIGASNNYPLQDVEGPLLLASPELLSKDAQGIRRNRNIAFSRQYTDFVYATVCGLKGQYSHLKGLTYDFLNLQPDYDTTHGYLPGRASLYPQYAFLRDTNRRLRERYPDLMLRGQIGWMWFGPWLAEAMSMCHNAGDHLCSNHRNFLDFHIDQQFANNIRLSNWFTNNCKMHPRHKMNSNTIHNGSNFRAWDYGAWEYCILSQIATSQVFGMLHNLPDEQNGEVFRKEDAQFFTKWIEWQKAHRDYYLREADLFGEPRLTGVDGYAYGNGTDSILFLCNPTWQAQSVAVPVNREIHLPEGRRSYTIKELYPEERYHIGLNEGVFAHGSTFVVDVPPQTVMVFEVRPDQVMETLLLGVEGKVAAGQDGLTISSVAGPPGTERTIALRVGKGYSGPNRVRWEGKPLPVRRRGHLLLAAIRFEGDRIEPEITDWRAIEDGDRLKIIARFTVPESARDTLARQRQPISAKFNSQEWLDRAAWLGWNRLIIYVPAVPAGLVAEELTAAKGDRVATDFAAQATLNGKPVAVRSNIMGENNAHRRWSGYFVDASGLAEYGKANELEIDLPKITEAQFYGLYLPNLTRRKTTAFRPLTAPKKLTAKPAPEAADAFIPKPVVAGSGDRLTVYLKLILTARTTVVINRDEIVAVGGRIIDQAVIGADSRWLTDLQRGRPDNIRLGQKPKVICLGVSGTRTTRLRFGAGAERCEVALGELLSGWERRGDPYDPHAADLSWPARKVEVTVELTAPWAHKLRVACA